MYFLQNLIRSPRYLATLDEEMGTVREADAKIAGDVGHQTLIPNIMALVQLLKETNELMEQLKAKK